MVILEAAQLSSWLSACTHHPSLACSALPPDGIIPLITALEAKAPTLGKPLTAALALNGINAIRQHHLLPSWTKQAMWADEITGSAVTTFDSELTERLKCLRKLQSASSAGVWLTAPPHTPDSTSFGSLEWQLLLQFRTGIPLFPENSTCRACKLPMDSMGDHALSCPASGMYRRHNRLRDTLFCLTHRAGWHPELEVCLPNSQARPADLLIHSTSCAHLACDITISHPLRQSAPPAARCEPNVSASEAERAKTTAQAGPCQAVGWTFQPAGFETTGGMGPGAQKLIRQLYRHLSMKEGISSSAMAEMVNQSLSLSLAKGRGEMLAASFPAD